MTRMLIKHQPRSGLEPHIFLFFFQPVGCRCLLLYRSPPGWQPPRGIVTIAVTYWLARVFSSALCTLLDHSNPPKPTCGPSCNLQDLLQLFLETLGMADTLLFLVGKGQGRVPREIRLTGVPVHLLSTKSVCNGHIYFLLWVDDNELQ